MYYLKSKDATEYSGLETYVADQFKVENTGWIPMFKSISLEEYTKSDELYKYAEHMCQQVENLRYNPFVIISLASNHLKKLDL